MLASWLFWTGIGSGIFGRKGGWLDDPRKTASQSLLSLTFPLTILAVRSAKRVFAVPGEMLGPWPMFLQH